MKRTEKLVNITCGVLGKKRKKKRKEKKNLLQQTGDAPYAFL